MSDEKKSLTKDTSPEGHNLEAKTGSIDLRAKRPSIEMFRFTAPGSSDPMVTLYPGYELTVDAIVVNNAYTDLLQSLIAQTKNNPSANIVDNYAEGTLDFKTSATTADYAFMNVQLPHSWDLGTDLYPHLHWFQAEDNVPNWLLQYRWQDNGAAKVTAWTNLPLDTDAFTYATGTILQISYSAPLSPPVGAGLSDIVQFRLIRDSANASTEFAGADPYTATVGAVNFDVHFKLDTLGSREEYAK